MVLELMAESELAARLLEMPAPLVVVNGQQEAAPAVHLLWTAGDIRSQNRELPHLLDS